MKVTLLNEKFYDCDESLTLFEGARLSGLCIEHSCLVARCRSCIAQILEGETIQIQNDLVLTDEERKNGYILTCNTKPLSDVKLNISDLGEFNLFEKKILPAKIQSIDNLKEDVVKVILRLPPTNQFKYNTGQYINISKGITKRSYSIASSYKENITLEFFIKKYENGLMSKYWFEEAKENDLLRIEGPLGSFFLRETFKKNIIFLATGTGIAPVKAILEQIQATPEKYAEKVYWLFFGARYAEDIFWEPQSIELQNLHFIKALSREKTNFEGVKGYVQDAMIQENINFEDAQVYACGSNDMIQSAKKVCMEHGLPEKEFFSDAFICTN